MKLPFLVELALFIAMFHVSRMLTVVIHELGHGITGLMLFKKNVSIYIGSYGDPTKGLHVKVGRVTIHIKYNLWYWNHGLCVADTENMTLARVYIFTFAGPFASLLLAGAGVYLLLEPDHNNWIRFAGACIGFSALLDFYQNLRPEKTPITLYDGTITFNDGQTLRDLRKNYQVYKDVHKLYDLYERHETKPAIDFFELKYKQSNVDFLRVGVAVYLRAREYEKARKIFQEIEDQITPTSADYCNAGLIFSYCNNHEKGLEYYEKSLALDADNLYALNNRGYALNLLGRHQEALKDFDRSIELDPGFAYAYNNRGLAKIKLGLPEDGLADIRRSLEIDPKNSYAYKNLGIYHLEQGHTDEALRLFRIAKEMDAGTHGIDELINATSQLTVC